MHSDTILAQILGPKRLEIIKFIAQNASDDGLLKASVLDICAAVSASKPTTISALKFLESKGALKKLKNGLYKITPKDG